tara:strand:+ start:273 stop:1202 length:930 start_codon:yes stop_codon:yes gene_type:complete
MVSYFLWPKQNISFLFHSFLLWRKKENLEKEFENLYSSGYPILCSSGRSAIKMVLKLRECERKDNIKIFPYASKCVIDAISSISNPSVHDDINNKVKIVYNQWGFINNEVCENRTIIEDSVDTLLLPNNSVFSLKSDFAIWSLPKIYGTSSGAVLWCSDYADKEKLIQIREKSKPSIMLWFIRILGNFSSFFNKIWSGFAPELPNITRFEVSEIFFALTKLDEIIEDRKSKINLLSDLLPENILIPENILPTVLPIYSFKTDTELKKLGIESGNRHFVNSKKIIKVIPLPIHQDVQKKWVLKTRKVLLG